MISKIMWKKRQHIENNKREVNRQGQAKVFSYYNNRQPSSSNAHRGSQEAAAIKKQRTFKAGAILAVFWTFVLAGCAIYASSLSSQPKTLLVSESKETSPVFNSTLPSGRELSTYNEEISSEFDKSWMSKSKMLIDTEAIASSIEANYPELGEVAVVLPFMGRDPIVKVVPARPVLVLSNGEGAYVLSRAGRVLSNAADYDKNTLRPLPVVRDRSGLRLETGSNALRGETVEFITGVVNQLDKKDISVRETILPLETPYEMNVTLDKRGYFVRFNLKGDSAVQTGALLAMIEEFDKKDISPSQYVDVRVEGKAYYK